MLPTATHLAFSDATIILDSHVADDADGNGVLDIEDEAHKTRGNPPVDLSPLTQDGPKLSQLHVSLTGALFRISYFLESGNRRLLIGDVGNYHKYLSPSDLQKAFNPEELNSFVASLIPEFREEINSSSETDLALLHYEYFQAALPLLQRDSVKAQAKKIVHDYQQWYDQHKGTGHAGSGPSAPVPLAPASPEPVVPATPVPSLPSPPASVEPPPPISVAPPANLPPITGQSWTGTKYVTLSLPSDAAINQISGYNGTNWVSERDGNTLKIYLRGTLPDSSAGHPIDFDITFADNSTAHVNAVVKKSLSKEELDKEIAASDGVLEALQNDSTLDSALGATGLNANMMNDIGSQIGSSSVMPGSGGLGARGGGNAGGGTAEGLAALGTKGRGSGGGSRVSNSNILYIQWGINMIDYTLPDHYKVTSITGHEQKWKFSQYRNKKNENELTIYLKSTIGKESVGKTMDFTVTTDQGDISLNYVVVNQ